MYSDDSTADPDFDLSTYGKRKQTIKDYFGLNTNKKKQLKVSYYSDTDMTNLSQASTSTVSSVSTISEGGDQDTRNKFSNSALFDGTFFHVITTTQNCIKAKCALCVPQEIFIKGPVTTTSNFLKHLRCKHGESSIEKYKSHKRACQNKIKETAGKMTSMNPMMTAFRTGNEKLLPALMKNKKRINEERFNGKFVNFFVQTMIPLSIIEHESFRELFSDFNVSIMSRRSLVRRVDEQSRIVTDNVKKNIQNSKYVCTTADIWSAKRRSFFGVTGHWFDKDLKRKSAALACRRFYGTHSFDRIAEILEDIHLQYELKNEKIVATVTDNGSNFVKSFKEFSSTGNIQEIMAEEREEYLEKDIFSLDSEESEEEVMQKADISFLSFDTQQFCLPKHVRCATHTLHLLATTDIKNVIDSNTAFRTRHERVLHKCTLLWKKAGKPKSAEIIQSVLGHTLSYPCITRWNSFYDGISQILQETNKLKELFDKLDIKDCFKDTELQYLEGYCRILKPLADTIDFLQGEEHTYYGYLLPSILSLKVKLEKLESDGTNSPVSILKKTLIEKLQTRFADLFSVNENSKLAVIAAVLIPSVKLRWIKIIVDKDNIDATKKYIIEMIVNEGTQLFSDLPENIANTSTMVSSAEDNFFDFGENPKNVCEISSNKSSLMSATTTKKTDNLVKTKFELELLKYLDDGRNTIDIFEEYTLLKELFIKYNTCLPSSAAVERLFSFATYINAPRRHALNDKLFEQLVLMKANKKRFS